MSRFVAFGILIIKNNIATISINAYFMLEFDFMEMVLNSQNVKKNRMKNEMMREALIFVVVSFLPSHNKSKKKMIFFLFIFVGKTLFLFMIHKIFSDEKPFLFCCMNSVIFFSSFYLIFQFYFSLSCPAVFLLHIFACFFFFSF